MKILLAISVLLILIGGYFFLKSIKYNNIYSSLKKIPPKQIDINFYQKGKYEFEFSNNNSTRYTTAVLALGITGAEINYLNNNDMNQLECNYKIYNEKKKTTRTEPYTNK